MHREFVSRTHVTEIRQEKELTIKPDFLEQGMCQLAPLLKNEEVNTKQYAVNNPVD